MRILLISNLYPPGGNGGYEQWCQEAAEGLLRRGHTLQVLTTPEGRDRLARPEPGWVRRSLHMEMEFGARAHGLHFFTGRERRRQANLTRLRQALASFRPDLVMIWGMWNLPRDLAALAEELAPGRVVYYLGDYWPTLPSQHEFYWRAQSRHWAAGLPKRLLRPLAERSLRRDPRPELRFDRALTPSAFLRDELVRRGVPLQSARVVLGGVDTRPYANGFPPAFLSHSAGPALRLLYAGRLSPEKGLETAIQALEDLVFHRRLEGLRLEVAGVGEAGYKQALRRQVAAAGLEPWVSFRGPVSKQAMPGLYRQNDVFLFTSTWQEPFGRVIVEALAAGLVVIGTATGGAGEILVEGETGLTYEPGSAAGLAGQIARLAADPDLGRQLVALGRRAAVEKFDLDRMVAEIEAYLCSVVAEVSSQ